MECILLYLWCFLHYKIKDVVMNKESVVKIDITKSKHVYSSSLSVMSAQSRPAYLL